jgi:GTP pyrophosphokinase
LYIYAPLAYRLGLFAIKSELEELSFMYSQPQIYKDIKSKVDAKKEFLANFLVNFEKPIIEKLKKQSGNFEIRYNEKTTYSIWQKMRANEIPFEEVNNTFSLDVIIDTKPENEKLECWAAYSIITSIYKPNNKRLHDWISTPKANGYEAIHTTVMGQNGNWVDMHIRSKRMDDIAQKGYAAYWKYKNKESVDAGLDEWLSKTRELLTESDEEAIAFINDFKKNLFAEEIVIFTPEGEMVNLPSEATVLDFAYAIHTDLGNHCIGANVNHRLVPVDYQIKSGDQVEVITSRIQQPNEGWFNYVVTARAKSRIKNAIKAERKSFRKEGEQKLESFFDQLKLENSKPNISKLISSNKLNGPLDLYYYIATNKIGFKEVKEVLTPQEGLTSWMRYFRFPFVRPKNPVLTQVVPDPDSKNPNGNNDLISDDFNELNYAVSKCCNPIPGDNVIGLVFPNEPIQIHKTNCDNAIKLMSHFGKNIVKAKWKQKEGITFLAGLQIKAEDKIGFIKQVTASIADDFQLNIRSFNLVSTEGLIDLKLTLYISSTKKLKKIIEHFKKTEGVIKVTRLDKFD